MATTEPKHLADLSDGESPTTQVTNALADQHGYPAQTADGKTVLIVEKRREGQETEVLVDSDGGEWVLHAQNQTLESWGTDAPPAEEPKKSSSSKKSE